MKVETFVEVVVVICVIVCLILLAAWGAQEFSNWLTGLLPFA
jgi:hypothetical protein